VRRHLTNNATIFLANYLTIVFIDGRPPRIAPVVKRSSVLLKLVREYLLEKSELAAVFDWQKRITIKQHSPIHIFDHRLRTERLMNNIPSQYPGQPKIHWFEELLSTGKYTKKGREATLALRTLNASSRRLFGLFLLDKSCLFRYCDLDT
jgi:hypothetical protein